MFIRQGVFLTNKIAIMKKVCFAVLLVVLLQLQAAQNKYYERSTGWVQFQSAHNINFVFDTVMILSCWGWLPETKDRGYTLLTDIHADNFNVIEYPDVVGSMTPRDMIPLPTGFATSGWMNNGIADPITNDTYDYQYLMETDFEGNLTNFYDLRQFPYQGNAKCMLHYPETNTYYVGGEAFISTMPTQMWLLKMTNGEVVWRNNYGTFNHRNQICKLLPASDGGVYAIATIDLYHPFYFGDFHIMKIDATGIVEWSTTHTVGFEDYCEDALLIEEGGFLLAGGSNTPNPVNNNKLYPSLLKLDESGNKIWSRVYFLNSNQGLFYKCFESGESFICIGSLQQQSGAFIKAFIVKINSNDGEPLWTRFFDYGISHDYFYNFTPAPQPLGGFVCVGRTEPASGADVYIVKTNCMGLLTLPQAAFSVSQDPNLPARFLFANQSQYAYPDSIDGGYYVLDWGDGSPPFICGQGYAPCIQDTIIHTYQTEGVYGVTLQAIVCNDTSTQIQSVCFGFAPNPQAEFSYQDFGGAIIFTNLSQNSYTEQGGYYVWDFGDGSPPSNQTNPTHSYEENGTYTVTLTLVVCGDTSVYTQEVAVQTVSLPPDPLKGEKTIHIYPNPAQNTLTFHRVSKSPSGDLGVTEDLEVSLYNISGQSVLQTTLPAGEPVNTVSIAHLPEGVYVYVVEDGGAVLVRGKVAVVR